MVKAIFSSDGEGERQKETDFYDHLNMEKRCLFYTRGNEGIVCFQRKGFVFGVVNKHSCAFSFEEAKSCSLSTCSNIPCYFGLLRYVECTIKSRILLAFLETESSLSSFSGPILSQKTAHKLYSPTRFSKSPNREDEEEKEMQEFIVSVVKRIYTS